MAVILFGLCFFFCFFQGVFSSVLIVLSGFLMFSAVLVS